MWIAQDYFKKNGVAAMSVRELYDFVVDKSIEEDRVEQYLEKVGFFRKPLGRCCVCSLIDVMIYCSF